MKVQQNLLNKWKLAYLHGDISKIVAADTEQDPKLKLKRFQVQSCLRGWSLTEKILSAVTKFYDERERKEIEIQNENSPY